jgi:ParB/RepB/Spo0J family partition protein
MSDALTRTQKLERRNVPIGELIPNEHNPNQMTDAEFNMLADNMEQTGITDPILVRRLPDGRLRIIGGHHRWEAAKLLGFEEVPVTIIDDPDFDDDAERFQIVRMNAIHGKMTPDRFVKLYQSLNKKYSDEIAAEMFGFVDEEDFKKLTKQMKASLPKDLQADFEKAAKEIKTVDGLAKLLNGMFTKYGATINHNFMILDYGGKDSVWIRMAPAEKKKLIALGYRCIDKAVTLDSVMNGLLDWALSNKGQTVLAALLKDGDPATIPEGMELPTLENLDE